MQIGVAAVGKRRLSLSLKIALGDVKCGKRTRVTSKEKRGRGGTESILCGQTS